VFRPDNCDFRFPQLPRSLSEYCLLKGGFEEYGGPWFPVTRDGEIVA